MTVCPPPPYTCTSRSCSYASAIIAPALAKFADCDFSIASSFDWTLWRYDSPRFSVDMGPDRTDRRSLVHVRDEVLDFHQPQQRGRGAEARAVVWVVEVDD